MLLFSMNFQFHEYLRIITTSLIVYLISFSHVGSSSKYTCTYQIHISFVVKFNLLFIT